MTLTVASWNVNSIRARSDRLVAWLARRQPDVVCLQETKVADASFPVELLREHGYHTAYHGQKTYNGVAILTRDEPMDVRVGFEDGVDDPEARLVTASSGGVAFVSAYVPNGSVVGSDKWAYKLAWLARLRRWLDASFDPDRPLVVCGDFNVAPEDRDVYDPEGWRDTVLCHPDVRAALEAVTAFGLTDTFRLHHAEAGLYSWWDYRQLAFPKNRGLRIDQIYASEPMRARCVAAEIDRDERKGKQPSDHAPVLAVFDD